jgi:spore coat polysaccharide biosynthesis protein SpsF
VRTAIIVQARMTSSRLPGKVMMPLGDKSVLSRVIERCKAVAGVDVVCCATTHRPEDDVVAKEAASCGAEVFRGSEEDVLDRYYKAAQSLGADVIMRVTSDCPLLDPTICAEVIKLRLTENADFATNNMPPSWPHGLDCEVFTFGWLERAAKEAVRPSDREHVSQFIRNHPEAQKASLHGPIPSCYDYRWTLDIREDYTMLLELFEKLPEGSSGWDWKAAKKIVDEAPHLHDINAGYDPLFGLNKSLAEDEDQMISWFASTANNQTYTHLGSEVNVKDQAGYEIVSLRRQDLLSIMEWRNEQMSILRQNTPLTPFDQKHYYENHIQCTFEQEQPKQILVSLLKDGILIGYGGLTNIDWTPKRAELSFLISSERAEDPKIRDEDYSAYLKLIKALAFSNLKLNRLFTETYDVRPHIIKVLEENGFAHEGRMHQHVVVDGKLTDSVLQACLRESVAA